MIKTKLVDSIFFEGLKSDIATGVKSPLFNSLHVQARDIVDKIMALETSSIAYKDIISASRYNKEAASVLALFSSLDKMSTSMTADYIILTKKYLAMYDKMKVMLSNYKKKLDILLDRNCVTIDTSYANEKLESKCGHFGNYLTLPYFVNTAKVYNGGVIMSLTSDAKVQYSNFESISSLPITNKPSFKVLSSDNEIVSRVRVVVAKDKYNAIYINIPSDKITSMKITAITELGTVEKTFNSGEGFFSFEKAGMSSIDITIKSNNYNPGKPYSMVISDILVMKNIEFMNDGFFKSSPVRMNALKRIDELTITNEHVQHDNTDIAQFIAISSDQGVMFYNKVDEEQYIDMTSYTLNNFKDAILTNDIIAYDRFKITYNNNDYYFYKYMYNSSSDIWDMDYKRAQIVTGINSTIMDPGTEVAQKYENWVQDSNYQTTKLINFSDNISINIGNRSFIMNGKEVTGVVQIPFGVVDVKVHNKDIDLTKNITVYDEVYGSESLMDDNFAFFFTGVPAFTSSGENGAPILEEKTFNINGPSVLYMNEPFIAGGFSVVDNNGVVYRLHLSKNVTSENTFSVEPNKGIIKVFPNSKAKSVTIRYYKCNINKPSIGILCRDLLTFTPIAGLIEPELGNTVFSIDGTFDERAIYIPNPFIDGNGNETDLHLHSQILYNNSSDQLYLSVMIEMKSTNKYVTPAIKAVTLSVK